MTVSKPTAFIAGVACGLAAPGLVPAAAITAVFGVCVTWLAAEAVEQTYARVKGQVNLAGLYAGADAISRGARRHFARSMVR